MNRTDTTKRIGRCGVIAVAVGVSLAACGDSNDTTQRSDTTVPVPSGVPQEGNEAGSGAPAAAPGEFEAASGTAITAVANVDARGCWYLTGIGSQSLLIAPEGTVLGDSGTALVTPDGASIDDGDRVDAFGSFRPLTELPGGPDGRWANYVAFCDPAHGDAVVTSRLSAAFDPAAEDPADYADEFARAGSALFDTDYGCGYGFATGDRDGRWALRIDTVQPPIPPAAGQVTLPDDRFGATVTAGAHLFANHCDDVDEWFEPDSAPVAVWPIVEGGFTFPETSGGGCDGSAMIVLTGAVVDVDGTDVRLDDIAISNQQFGCFAG